MAKPCRLFISAVTPSALRPRGGPGLLAANGSGLPPPKEEPAAHVEVFFSPLLDHPPGAEPPGECPPAPGYPVSKALGAASVGAAFA